MVRVVRVRCFPIFSDDENSVFEDGFLNNNNALCSGISGVKNL